MTESTSVSRRQEVEGLREAARRVQANYRAVKLYRGKMPHQRTVARETKDTVAEQFDAEGASVGMYTKLFHKDEPAVKRVNAVFAKIDLLWRGPGTYWHPDPGVRLIKETLIPEFDAQIQRLSATLAGAAMAMYQEMPALRQRERGRKGRLYREAHYMFDPRTVFVVKARYPNVEVPSYLSQLKPDAYKREIESLRQDFEEVCLRKEQEMMEDLFSMLDHLQERLSGLGEGGKRKSFKDATAGKIFEAIEQADQELRENGIGRGTVQSCFAQLKQIVGGVEPGNLPQKLRKDPQFRDIFREGCREICNSVFNSATVKPRRALLLAQAKKRREEKKREAEKEAQCQSD